MYDGIDGTTGVTTRAALGEHWRPYFDYQTRNCEPLLSNPAWDGLLRHPKIVAARAER
jgi:hypothetical protein